MSLPLLAPLAIADMLPSPLVVHTEGPLWQHVGHLLAAAHVHHVAPTRCSTQPIARRFTCLQREENDQLVDAPARELRMLQQRASKTHRRPEEPAVAQQRKIEIEEDAIRAQPGDTNSTALRPSIVRENVGHALDTVMTGSLEPHQAVMHHGPADEVIVAGAPNSEMGDENIRL